MGMEPRDAAAGLPALPDVDYLIGLGSRMRRHAVAYLAAREGYDQACLLSTDPGSSAGSSGVPWAVPVCADGPEQVQVVAKLGPFPAATPWLDRGGGVRVCPACRWQVAAARGALGAELDALAPTGRERQGRAELGQPDLVLALCQAALLADEDIDQVAQTTRVPGARGAAEPEWALFDRPRWQVLGRDDPPQPSQYTLALLAQVCEHAPQVVYPVACLEGDCDHDRLPPSADDEVTGRGPGCARPAAALRCAGCTVTAGGWAGLGEGAEMLSVPGPCGVLSAAGAALGVPVIQRHRHDRGHGEQPSTADAR